MKSHHDFIVSIALIESSVPRTRAQAVRLVDVGGAVAQCRRRESSRRYTGVAGAAVRAKERVV